MNGKETELEAIESRIAVLDRELSVLQEASVTGHGEIVNHGHRLEVDASLRLSNLLNRIKTAESSISTLQTNDDWARDAKTEYIYPKTYTDYVSIGYSSKGSEILSVDGNIETLDGHYIKTDKVRARDADGLLLEDDGGNGITIADGGAVTVAQAITLSTIAHETTDVDVFLVSNSGLVKYRTGGELASDIGASVTSHRHDGQTLQHDAVNSDGGAFAFNTTGAVTFNQAVIISGTLGCGEITVADGSGINLQEDITFTGATTENLIKLPDNLADALSVKDATGNVYQKFVSTTGTLYTQFPQDVAIGVTVPTATLHVLNTEDVAEVTIFNLEGKRGTPTNNDTMFIYYRMNNDTPASYEYARTTITAEDITTGSEEGSLLFEVSRAGSLETVLKMSATNIVLNEPGADRDFRVEAVGVVNALFVQGSDGHVGIGAEPVNSHLYVYNNAVNTANDFYGIYNYHVKTAGATTYLNKFRGFHTEMELNQSGGETDHAMSLTSIFRHTLGTVGAVGNTRGAYVLYGLLDLNAGTITGDAIGLYANIDQEAAHTISGNAYAGYLNADYDGTLTGTAYMLYINEGSNIDYGIYQNGTAPNVLGGNLTTTGTLTVSDNTDATTILGRCKIGSISSDYVTIAHYDRLSSTDYSILIGSTGALYINAPSTRDIRFRINNVDIGRWEATGNAFYVGISNPLSTGALLVALSAVDVQRFGDGETTAEPQIVFTRARGSEGSPTAVTNTCEIGNFLFRGYDGTTALSSAQFGGLVDAAVSTGVVPQAIVFRTGTGSTPSERVRISSGGGLFLTELAAADTDIAGKGQFWVKNDTPNVPMFTDDAGTDHQLAYV